MNKKLSRLIEPNLQPFFLCLIVMVAVTATIQPVLAAVEGVTLAALYIYHRRQTKRRHRNVTEYIESITGGTDSITKSNLLNTPLPVVVFRADGGEIVWANEGFASLTDDDDDILDMQIDDIAPGLDIPLLLTGEPVQAAVGERTFQVYGAASRLGGQAAAQGHVITAYFVDFTESQNIKSLYEASRPVVCLLVFDNYEELMKTGSEAAKSSVLAQIDERLNNWTNGTGGLLRKYDRDHYLFLCDEHGYQRMEEDKFSILESIHQVVSEGGVSASLSIGIGRDCDSYDGAFKWAQTSIELALSRGGDQAVVKDSMDFQFYGGRAKSTEKRTKVKSRVMAKALGELLSEAGQVYIMGHQYADMDAVGAAAGVCCAARKRGKKAQIVIDLEGNNARPLVRKLRDMPEYKDVFISGQDAFVYAQPGALLVVVDTNRPDLVENRQLLEACSHRVAVIDHHRRAADYIENPALNFHEPYASSASELVTELLQYLVEPSDLLRGEAEALLAGIMLDTKNFNMRAGSRTFEAAAFLRRAGADPAEVRRYFQSDLESMIQRYDIIRNAKMVHGDIAVALAEKEVSRVTAAKAADDLLNLQGIQASIVLYRQGDGVSMSARSLDEVNVQVILESLGGGGNATVAGGHVPNTDMDTVRRRIVESINRYYSA